MTANAGTNLNTSALALETGGNLASVKTNTDTLVSAIKAEDAVHSTGDNGIAAWSVRQDTAASTAGTTGDYAALTTDNTGRLWVRVGASDTLTPGTSAANLGKAEDAASATGDTMVAVASVRRDGAITTSPTSAAGDYQEFATDNYGQIRTAVQARTTNPSAAADGNGAILMADKLGKQVVVGSIRDLKADQQTTLTSTTTETTIVTAIGSTFCDLYGLIVANTSATATEVNFRDVIAGSVRFTVHVPAGDTRGFMLPESAAYKQATVNTAWTAQCATSVASIKISALYVKNI